MTDGATADTVVLRPNGAAYRAGLRRRAALFGGVVVAVCASQVLRADSLVEAGSFGALIVGTAVLCLGLVWWHLRDARVILHPDRVERRGALVRDRVLLLDDELDGILTLFSQPGSVETTLIVVGTGGRFRLSGSMWSDATLLHIGRHVHARHSTAALTARDIERIVPGAMPFWHLHPWWTGIGAAVVVVGGVVAGVIGVFMVRDLPPWDDYPPGGVASSTVAGHDAFLDGVETAQPAPWSPPDVELRQCDDLDGKGWIREVHRTATGAGPAQTGALASALAAAGADQRDVVVDRRADGTLVTAFIDDGAIRSAQVHVLEGGEIDLSLRSGCETGRS